MCWVQTIGVSAAAIVARLQGRLGGAEGLFGTFIRRVKSGGLAVQAAMLLLAHTVSKLNYLLRCLPSAATGRLARDWDDMLLSAAAEVLALATDEASSEATREALQRPRRSWWHGPIVGGDSLAARLRCIHCSVGGAAGHTAANRPTAARIAAAPMAAGRTGLPSHGRRRAHPAVPACAFNADTFTGHYQATPASAANLQHKLTTVATNNTFHARVERVNEGRRRRARAGQAARWPSALRVPLEDGRAHGERLQAVPTSTTAMLRAATSACRPRATTCCPTSAVRVAWACAPMGCMVCAAYATARSPSCDTTASRGCYTASSTAA